MTRILLAGATGLIGSQVARLLAAAGHELHIVGRRQLADLPPEVEQHVTVHPRWFEIARNLKAEVAISCLGTTMKQAGSEAAFRLVDFDLVTAFAEANMDAGTRQFIAVSSVGANHESKNFYLKTKGETESKLSMFGFERTDFLRPGLLRGDRAGPSRSGEGIAALISPLTDLLLLGALDRYRSISAEKVARAIKALVTQPAPGCFIHENRAIETLAG